MKRLKTIHEIHFSTLQIAKEYLKNKDQYICYYTALDVKFIFITREKEISITAYKNDFFKCNTELQMIDLNVVTNPVLFLTDHLNNMIKHLELQLKVFMEN